MEVQLLQHTKYGKENDLMVDQLGQVLGVTYTGYRLMMMYQELQQLWLVVQVHLQVEQDLLIVTITGVTLGKLFRQDSKRLSPAFLNATTWMVWRI